MILTRRQKLIATTITTLVALGGVTSFYLMSQPSATEVSSLSESISPKPDDRIAEEAQSGPKVFEPMALTSLEAPESQVWSEEQSQKLSEVLDLERKVFLEPEEEKELERYIETDFINASLILKSPKQSADLQQAQEDIVELMIADMEKNQDVRLALTLVNEAELSGSGSEPELHLAGLVGELLFHAFAYDPGLVQSWASQNDNSIKAKIFENTQRLAERNLQESQSEL